MLSLILIHKKPLSHVNKGVGLGELNEAARASGSLLFFRLGYLLCLRAALQIMGAGSARILILQVGRFFPQSAIWLDTTGMYYSQGVSLLRSVVPLREI